MASSISPLIGPGLSPAVEKETGEWIDRQASAKATKAAKARKVSKRRRNVDPTTCDRDYSADELEFIQAIELYKKTSGRSFPTWSEVLEVARSLGYQKVM